LSVSAGWRNVIVSNHGPELPDLVFQLGLADHVHAVVNSADNGYEKPHPQAFRLALQAAGDPTTAWIVGDNPIADIAGAAQVGIPGVLARSPEFDSAFIQRIETSYGHSRFPDWMRHCDIRASTAVEAVQLILSHSS
jgi:FMN phosphatase YigB (HAD superfamily)